MFLNHIGKPSVYLPACMALWGLISVLTGVTHDFVGALLTRFFLGICESTFLPVSYHWRVFRAYSNGMSGCRVPSFKVVQTQ